MICVGKPSNPNGSLDAHFAETVSWQIGYGLHRRCGYPLMVFRSMLLPGKVEEFMIPLPGKTSGKCTGKDFGVADIPELLRQGSAVKDFFNPAFTLIGTNDAKSAEIPEKPEIPGPHFRTNTRTAAAVEYLCNAYHAVKIPLANEISILCQFYGWIVIT